MGGSFLWTGLAAGTLDWLAVRYKSLTAWTDVTLRPSAGGGAARQMARSRIGDGLSIKGHFLGGGDLPAPRHKEECRGPPFADLGNPSLK